MIPNGPWALHKDQHPPTSLSNTNTLQKFIMELVTSTFRVCLLILTFLCISASHGFRSGQPWWLRWRRPGGCRQEDDAPLSHLQQGVPKQIQHQGESFKIKLSYLLLTIVLYFRFTYEHTQERSRLGVNTAARRSDRRLIFSSTCPYTRESPGTNV